MTGSRAQQLDEREAAVAAREQRVGGGMDSELLAETLQAMPNGNERAGSREVRALMCHSVCLTISPGLSPCTPPGCQQRLLEKPFSKIIAKLRRYTGMQGSEERLAAREAILEMREAAVAAKEAAADDSASNGPAESRPDTSIMADPQEANQNGYARTLSC